MTRGLDLLNEIADRAGWRQIVSIEGQTLSNEERKLVRLLNRVLQTLQGEDDWPLLRKDGALTLVAKDVSDTDTIGTEQWVAATQNSTTITVANGDFNDSYINRQFQIEGNPTIYRIVDVLSVTELVLDKAWVDASIVVGDERIFSIGVDQYALPTDFDRPATGFQNFLAPYHIQATGPNNFSKLRQRRSGIVFGDPTYYTIYGRNDGDTAWKIHFHEWPSTARVLRFSYQQIHPTINSDNDTILFPVRYNEMIIDCVLHLLQRDYEDSAKTQQTLMDKIRTFSEQTPSMTDNKQVMRPSKSIRRNHQRAASRAGVRIDYGSYFDVAGNIRLP